MSGEATRRLARIRVSTSWILSVFTAVDMEVAIFASPSAGLQQSKNPPWKYILTLAVRFKSSVANASAKSGGAIRIEMAITMHATGRNKTLAASSSLAEYK